MKKLILLVALLIAGPSSAAALPSLSIPTALQCTEGGTVNLKVTRIGSKTTTATFHYATANGTAIAPDDYTAMSGQQSVRKNSLSYTFTLRCGTDNSVYSGNRNFVFTITAVSGATISQGRAIVTVLENDPQPLPPVQCPDGTTVPAGQVCPTPSPPSSQWIATTLGSSPYARAVKTCSSIYRSTFTDQIGVTYNGVVAGTIYKLPLGGPGSFPNPNSYNAGWSHQVAINIDGQTGHSWTVLDFNDAPGWVATVAVECLEGVRPE